ncbi:hypothetical protein NDU88_000639 [Pleurodeles waltl]|uniref:Uncharacterized protein n=1 Tax=Pleurodeles waltl TaxID=8319 RepID=A0AAV7KPG4_PLEWA|nr:hypothetical protein NDU88_000639 [Pleurodeles waltl]
MPPKVVGARVPLEASNTAHEPVAARKCTFTYNSRYPYEGPDSGRRFGGITLQLTGSVPWHMPRGTKAESNYTIYQLPYSPGPLREFRLDPGEACSDLSAFLVRCGRCALCGSCSWLGPSARPVKEARSALNIVGSLGRLSEPRAPDPTCSVGPWPAAGLEDWGNTHDEAEFLLHVLRTMRAAWGAPADSASPHAALSDAADDAIPAVTTSLAGSPEGSWAPPKRKRDSRARSGTKPTKAQSVEERTGLLREATQFASNPYLSLKALPDTDIAGPTPQTLGTPTRARRSLHGLQMTSDLQIPRCHFLHGR